MSLTDVDSNFEQWIKDYYGIVYQGTVDQKLTYFGKSQFELIRFIATDAADNPLGCEHGSILQVSYDDLLYSGTASEEFTEFTATYNNGIIEICNAEYCEDFSNSEDLICERHASGDF